MARSSALTSALLFFLTAQLRLAEAQCYFRDGTPASDFAQCPGVNFCCEEVKYCETNGLCRDKNNHANGSLTYFPGDADPGPYNYTGLYSTPACNNAGFEGCDVECTASNASAVEYVWACTGDLLNYCCHSDSVALDNGDCCSDATRFQLSSPVPLRLASATSGSVASSTVAPTTSSSSSKTPAASAKSHASRTKGSKSGLSEGATIGIGVAIPVFALIVAALIALFWRTQRLQKRLAQQQQQQQQQKGPSTSAGTAMQDVLGTRGGGPQDASGWGKAELDNTPRAPPAELQGLTSPVEAPVTSEADRRDKKPSAAPVELG